MSEWEPPDEFDEYRLVERIGAGGMGVVYLAHDRLLDRAVAIKFLKATLSPAARRRFVIEARAAARIHHPNVMGIHRVGELEDHPYIVTEYVRGTSLSALPLPLPWTRVLELGIGLARGLATAHRQGVLHRDIKLLNAIVSADTGEVKLLDFSLAKVESGDEHDDEPDDEPDEPEPPHDHDPHADSPHPREAAAPPAEAARDAPAIASNQVTIAPPAEPDEESSALGGLLESAALLDREWHAGRAALTQAGSLIGTPHYMAPELWRAERASRETDVYALGVLLYILCVGRPPHTAASTTELGVRIMQQAAPPVRDAAPSVDPRLAATIDRCLRADPAERFASGDAIREALELLHDGERRPRATGDNPYRGLQAFEAEHRDLFFGRGAELRAVLDRLRAEPFVLVAGDSGVGKSSLCRAGVGPSVVEGALEPERRWTVTTMTPGRHPLRSLVAMLTSCFDLEQDVILAMIESQPDALGWLLHKKLGRSQGRLLFVDQLEELVTLGERGELETVGKILAQLATGIPGVRLLASVRGDFLTRVAAIPHLGDELARAIYLLRPLSAAGIREAVVAPAQALGVRYESAAMIDELVAAGTESSLPILQFALAELWEVRDPAARVITSEDLRGIGGVSGALARHAEGLLASLLPAQRVAAKQLLLRLVTLDDTRASLPRDELVRGSEDSRLALEALVRGRLLVIREDDHGTLCEIAHEALIRDWGSLRRWLDEATEIRELRHRLELAASDWERLERPRAALWNKAQLAEARVLDRGSLRRHEAEFLAASERAVARGRLVRRVAAVAIPAALVATYGLVQLQAAAELRARVDARLEEARGSLARARGSLDEFLVARSAAFAQYDAGTDGAARVRWTAAKAAARASDLELSAAARELERALTLDPRREDVRDTLGDALLARAELAGYRRDEASAAELVDRLAMYDAEGRRMATWNAPAHLSIETSPAGASVELVEYALDDVRRRIASEPITVGTTPLADLELPPGSYRLQLAVEGRPPVAYPVLLERGESLAISVELPTAAAIPSGFVYVPAGRFLLGCSDETLCDVFYNSVPLHPTTTGSFLIGRHEVTYGEWIEMLEDTRPEGRFTITPRIDQSFVVVSLAPVAEGGWKLSFPRAGGDVEARVGEPLVLRERDRRATQDWSQLPVLGITLELASAHIEWLDRTGRVPGARLCSDREWERAGRGADSRLYPHGDHLELDDANIDVTYGQRYETAGPDVVGSHPATRSPFGVDDLSGNAGEWTIDPLHGDAPVLRGGAFFIDAVSAHLVGRQVVPPGFTDGTVGMRVCAPYPLPRPVGEPRPADESVIPSP